MLTTGNNTFYGWWWVKQTDRWVGIGVPGQYGKWSQFSLWVFSPSHVRPRGFDDGVGLEHERWRVLEENWFCGIQENEHSPQFDQPVQNPWTDGRSRIKFVSFVYFVFYYMCVCLWLTRTRTLTNTALSARPLTYFATIFRGGAVTLP